MLRIADLLTTWDNAETGCEVLKRDGIGPQRVATNRCVSISQPAGMCSIKASSTVASVINSQICFAKCGLRSPISWTIRCFGIRPNNQLWKTRAIHIKS